MPEDQASAIARCRDEKRAKKMNLPFRCVAGHDSIRKDLTIDLQCVRSDQLPCGHLQ